MKGKLIIIAFLVSTLILSVATFEAYAFDHGKTKGRHLDLEKKFSSKAHFILENEDELDLSDKQVGEIKELKIKTKKDLIRVNAEIDILALDMKAEMWKDSIDTNAVNKLIDKKYDFKKEKAKSLIAARAALNGILTKEQKEEMKELWKKRKKEKIQSWMMKGKMKHPMMGGKT